jgi:hypothetical protein
MGFRVRKQVRLGGLRLNLSKSGASVSTKVGPVTLNSRGRQTVHLAPGLSYTVNSGRRTTSPRRGTATVQAHPPVVPVAGRRSYLVAYALTLFLGFTGLQHYYLGYRARGRAYAFTLGWLTLGWLWDLFAIPFEVAKVNTTLS